MLKICWFPKGLRPFTQCALRISNLWKQHPWHDMTWVITGHKIDDRCKGRSLHTQMFRCCPSGCGTRRCPKMMKATGSRRWKQRAQRPIGWKPGRSTKLATNNDRSPQTNRRVASRFRHLNKIFFSFYILLLWIWKSDIVHGFSYT